MEVPMFYVIYMFIFVQLRQVQQEELFILSTHYEALIVLA